MRPEHRVGEKPDAIPTLVEAGISKNLAHRARNAAAASAEKFEQIIKEGRERIASESDRVTTKLIKAHAATQWPANKSHDPSTLSGRRSGAVFDPRPMRKPC
jgi:hypothetical protein